VATGDNGKDQGAVVWSFYQLPNKNPPAHPKTRGGLKGGDRDHPIRRTRGI